MFFNFDITDFIATIGYFGIAAIAFAESGLFVGFFIPGDTLLFTSGFLASQGYLNMIILLPVATLGSVLGDSFGYLFGRKVGSKIFTRKDSLFFHHDQLERAENFYETHGGKALILARFMPVIRTFVPILAGVTKMHYRKFLGYNIVGGFLWSSTLAFLGYYLGNTFPYATDYLLILILGVVGISVLPAIIHLIRSKELREQIFARLYRKK